MSGAAAQNKPLTPNQIKVLDSLLAVGADRPLAPEGLTGELTSILEAAAAEAVPRWTEKTFYLTKGQFLAVGRCEGQVLAEANSPRGGVSVALLVGTIAHKAIQISFTHPAETASEYVRKAVSTARMTDSAFQEWWLAAEASQQSDLITQATSRVTNFLDDFPPLQEAWSPRFEEPMVAKAGRLTMSCRPDLVIGRPRGDRKQTLLIVDFKTSDVKDEHEREARFYALVAALRHGIAPWRSTVYSLSSGAYTHPDVTADMLRETAAEVGRAVTSLVDVLTEARPPNLQPGGHCRFCPARSHCPSALVA